MTITIMPGSGEATFDFAVSPLAELVASVHLLGEPDHHRDRRTWVADTRGMLGEELSEALRALGYLWRVSRPDIFLPASGSLELADELDEIDRLSDEDWVGSVLLTSSCGTVRLRADLGSPLVDDRARELALERAAARGPRQILFVEEVLANPATARERVRALLVECDRVYFGQEWERLGPQLAAEASGRRDVLATLGISATLPTMSTALSYGNGRIVVDKLQDASTSGDGSGVTFLPTSFGDPHILVVYAPGRRPTVQYPVRRTAAVDDIGLDLVQARIRALDHPLRLRLLRSLLRGAFTTTELADSWAVTAPEVSRHLAFMRDAGLVVARRDGRFVLYSADAVAVNRLGADVLSGLLR